MSEKAGVQKDENGEGPAGAGAGKGLCRVYAMSAPSRVGREKLRLAHAQRAVERAAAHRHVRRPREAERRKLRRRLFFGRSLW